MEFWQLLVGTISGFIIAFLAEPVKTFFENRNKKNRLRKSLYREICYLYEALYALIEEVKEQRAISLGMGADLEPVSIDCYKPTIRVFSRQRSYAVHQGSVRSQVS